MANPHVTPSPNTAPAAAEAPSWASPQPGRDPHPPRRGPRSLPPPARAAPGTAGPAPRGRAAASWPHLLRDGRVPAAGPRVAGAERGWLGLHVPVEERGPLGAAAAAQCRHLGPERRGEGGAGGGRVPAAGAAPAATRSERGGRRARSRPAPSAAGASRPALLRHTESPRPQRMSPPDVIGKHRDVTARPPRRPGNSDVGSGPAPAPPAAAVAPPGGGGAHWRHRPRPAGPGSGNGEPGAAGQEELGHSQRHSVGHHCRGAARPSRQRGTRGAGGVQTRNEWDAGHPSAKSGAAALGWILSNTNRAAATDALPMLPC